MRTDYERWENLKQIPADATDQEILDGYADEIEALKQKGGYVTADVINIVPTTEGLDAMLNKFNKEHWHDEDEVEEVEDEVEDGGRGIVKAAADEMEVREGVFRGLW